MYVHKYYIVGERLSLDGFGHTHENSVCFRVCVLANDIKGYIPYEYIYSETCVIRTPTGEEFCVRFRQVFDIRRPERTHVRMYICIYVSAQVRVHKKMCEIYFIRAHLLQRM